MRGRRVARAEIDLAGLRAVELWHALRVDRADLQVPQQVQDDLVRRRVHVDQRLLVLDVQAPERAGREEADHLSPLVGLLHTAAVSGHVSAEERTVGRIAHQQFRARKELAGQLLPHMAVTQPLVAYPYEPIDRGLIAVARETDRIDDLEDLDRLAQGIRAG